MGDLADQVQSLFYNDIHFNSVNARMHFKVDTGVDGNLMPISMFMQLFPKVSLDTLSRMIERVLHCLHTITHPVSNMVLAASDLASRENPLYAIFCC